MNYSLCSLLKHNHFGCIFDTLVLLLYLCVYLDVRTNAVGRENVDCDYNSGLPSGKYVMLYTNMPKIVVRIKTHPNEEGDAIARSWR